MKPCLQCKEPVEPYEVRYEEICLPALGLKGGLVVIPIDDIHEHCLLGLFLSIPFCKRVLASRRATSEWEARK